MERADRQIKLFRNLEEQCIFQSMNNYEKWAL